MQAQTETAEADAEKMHLRAWDHEHWRAAQHQVSIASAGLGFEGLFRMNQQPTYCSSDSEQCSKIE